MNSFPFLMQRKQLKFFPCLYITYMTGKQVIFILEKHMTCLPEIHALRKKYYLLSVKTVDIFSSQRGGKKGKLLSNLFSWQTGNLLSGEKDYIFSGACFPLCISQIEVTVSLVPLSIHIHSRL